MGDKANIWNPGDKPIYDGQDSLGFQVFHPAEGDEILAITDFVYNTGSNSILLFRGGLVQVLNEDFTELDASSLKLTLPAKANEEFLVIGFTQIGNVDTIYASVTKMFLGVKAADPTTDNQGDPLLVGAYYFNTVTGGRIWTGVAWVPAAVVMSDVAKNYSTNVIFNIATRSKKFTIANAAAQVGMKVVASVAGVVGANRTDELELEAIVVLGRIAVNGQVILNVQSLWGKLLGTYTVAYSLQS